MSEIATFLTFPESEGDKAYAIELQTNTMRICAKFEKVVKSTFLCTSVKLLK